MDELAVITGAGSGIGRSVAGALATRRLHVVLVGRTRASLEEVAESISTAGASAEVVVAGVGVGTDVDRVVATIGDRPVAAVVHSAGNHPRVKCGSTSRDELRHPEEAGVRASTAWSSNSTRARASVRDPWCTMV